MMGFNILRFLVKRLYSLPGKCHCIICGKKFIGFLPYRDGSAGLPDLMKELNIVGSNVDRFECPRCGATDRERHLKYYLERLNLINRFSKAKVLHFAPEKNLREWFSELGMHEYVAADLYPSGNGVMKIDIQKINYDDGYFDIVIANHVLEHVEDDLQAVAEVTRVLNKGGLAILQTPFSSVLLHTFEDKGINSYAARLQAYGQEDHVRLYGIDWTQRFEAYGLVGHVKEHIAVLSDIDELIEGVNQSEPFMIFVKSI